MSERYTRLFTLPGPLYAQGSPLIILAGALLKDNQTGRVLAQLKLKNVGTKSVKAVKVSVTPLDAAGMENGQPVEHQYLDLHAARDGEFGQKEPIPFPIPPPGLSAEPSPRWCLPTAACGARRKGPGRFCPPPARWKACCGIRSFAKNTRSNMAPTARSFPGRGRTVAMRLRGLEPAGRRKLPCLRQKPGTAERL